MPFELIEIRLYEVAVMASTWSWLLACVALISLQGINGFYSEGDLVQNLDPNSFEKNVKGNRIWLIEFYAPWCGHCQSLVPIWKDTAKALQGVIHVGAIDADQHKDLAREFNVQGFPTVKLISFTGGKRKVSNFKGDRSAAGIIDWTLTQAKKISLARIGAKPGKESKEGRKPPPAGEGSFYGPNSDLVALSDNTFHQEVQGSDIWLIEFYAPWCGHCKSLKPDWEQLASNVKGRVKIGAVDCTANDATCQEFGIQGFPTIKYFGEEKDDPSDYQGGRDLESLESFVLGEWRKSQPPPEAKQLVDQHVLDIDCTGSDESPPKKLCFLAFLPHILDSKAAGRKAYIEILDSLATKYADRPFSYLWAEGGVQINIEKTLEVGGFGYPALVALSPKDGKFATLRDSFDLQHCSEFIERLRIGRERVSSISGSLPELVSSDPWDGQDGAEIEEEEFSLEDLMSDDKEL